MAALLLLQSFKLSELVTGGADASGAVLSPLVRWVVVDFVALSLLGWLRIPWLSWGWRGNSLARLCLFSLDWLLFAHWTASRPPLSLGPTRPSYLALTSSQSSQFSPWFLVPSFILDTFRTYMATGEFKVSYASILPASSSHLIGEFTVHILATASVSPYMPSPLSKLIHAYLS